MRLGAPVFVPPDDPLELAREHKRLGYGAAYCPPLSLDAPERVRATRDAFAREGVTIAEVGAWRNLMAADASERKANLAYVCERLALADEVGALCAVDIAGSLNPTGAPSRWHGPHPHDLTAAAFDLTVENVRHIVDSVKPRRSRFALEMMPWTLPDSPDSFLRLIDAVDRPALAAHIDPVNLVNCPARYFDTGSLIRECFVKLGQWVVSCHAKDTIMHERLTVHIDEVRPGLGALDYRVFLSELARLPRGTPLMVEHLKTAEEYALAVEYIRRVAADIGAEFE